MKGLKTVIICAVLYLMERVFFPHFCIFSQTPWLMFSFCMVSAAQEEEFHRAVILAAVCGLLTDLGGGGAAGTAMAVYAICAALVNVFSARIFSESLPLCMLLIFAFSIPAQLLYCAANYEINGILRLVCKTILPLSAINTVCALIIYPLYKRIYGTRRRIT